MVSLSRGAVGAMRQQVTVTGGEIAGLTLLALAKLTSLILRHFLKLKKAFQQWLTIFVLLKVDVRYLLG
jgi:hypothetical protein